MDGEPTSWHATSRLESLRGERRANALRVLGIAVFYAIEVINYRGLALGPIDLPQVEGVDVTFHAMATALTVAWMGVAAAVMLALRTQIFPPALKYLTTGADLVLLTSVLTLADGPRSPVLLAYFLVIPLAGLRMSPRLVLFSTGGAVAGYLFLLGEVAQRRPVLAVPPHWQVTTVAALVLAGVVTLSMVRASRRAAEAFHAIEGGREGETA